jgi:hypothetical protein
VALLVDYRINAFLEGFYDIIPKRLISIFNEQELELLISGLPNVDIEDLRANTEYHKYQPTSLQVRVNIIKNLWQKIVGRTLFQFYFHMALTG